LRGVSLIFFQLFLLGFLALPIAAGRVDFVWLVLAFAVLLGASVWRLNGFDKENNKIGWIMLAFFSLLCVGLTVALYGGVLVFVALAITLSLLAVFFAGIAYMSRNVTCRVIGYCPGYAVVAVPKQLAGVVSAGVYAVACARKPNSKTVCVRFSLDKKGSVLL
jgi:hypothetical protein